MLGFCAHVHQAAWDPRSEYSQKIRTHFHLPPHPCPKAETEQNSVPLDRVPRKPILEASWEGQT